MDQYDDTDDLTFEGEASGPKALRDELAKVKKEMKRLAERNAVLETGERKRVITQALTARGVNPKVADFMPADIEPTEESVVSWLTENADVFGVQIQPTEEQQDAATQADHIRRMAAVERGSQPSGSGDLLSQISQFEINSDADLEQLMAAVRGGQTL